MDAMHETFIDAFGEISLKHGMKEAEPLYTLVPLDSPLEGEVSIEADAAIRTLINRLATFQIEAPERIPLAGFKIAPPAVALSVEERSRRATPWRQACEYGGFASHRIEAINLAAREPFVKTVGLRRFGFGWVGQFRAISVVERAAEIDAAIGTFVDLGMIVSSIFWFYRMPYWTYGTLFLFAAIDVVLYLTVGNVLQCYQCQSQYRGLAALDEHEGFDLEIHEKHRQQQIRLARAGIAGGKGTPPPPEQL